MCIHAFACNPCKLQPHQSEAKLRLWLRQRVSARRSHSGLRQSQSCDQGTETPLGVAAATWGKAKAVLMNNSSNMCMWAYQYLYFRLNFSCYSLISNSCTKFESHIAHKQNNFLRAANLTWFSSYTACLHAACAAVTNESWVKQCSLVLPRPSHPRGTCPSSGGWPSLLRINMWYLSLYFKLYIIPWESGENFPLIDCTSD